MNLEEINKLAKGDLREQKRVPDLEENRLYTVEDLRIHNTRYGKKCVIDLDGDIFVYLPAKLSKRLVEDYDKEFVGFLNRVKKGLNVMRIPGEANIEFFDVKKSNNKKRRVQISDSDSE